MSCQRRKWTERDDAEVIDAALKRIKHKWPLLLKLTDHGTITGEQACTRFSELRKVPKTTQRPKQQPHSPHTMEQRALAVGIMFESPPAGLLTVAEDVAALPAARASARRAIAAHRKSIRGKVVRAEQKHERSVHDSSDNAQVPARSSLWAALPFWARNDYYREGYTSIANTEPWAYRWFELEEIREEEAHILRDLQWVEAGGKRILGKITRWISDWLKWAQRKSGNMHAARQYHRSVSLFIISRIVKIFRRQDRPAPLQMENLDRQREALTDLRTMVGHFVAAVKRSHNTAPDERGKPSHEELQTRINDFVRHSERFVGMVLEHRQACRGRVHLLWRRLWNMWSRTILSRGGLVRGLDYHGPELESMEDDVFDVDSYRKRLATDKRHRIGYAYPASGPEKD
jgi:hypothetical protein